MQHPARRAASNVTWLPARRLPLGRLQPLARRRSSGSRRSWRAATCRTTRCCSRARTTRCARRPRSRRTSQTGGTQPAPPLPPPRRRVGGRGRRAQPPPLPVLRADPLQDAAPAAPDPTPPAAGLEPYGGMALWALTGADARVADALRGRAARRAATSSAARKMPDETFFQTMLLSSPLARRVDNEQLHYMDWSAGSAHPAHADARPTCRSCGPPECSSRASSTPAVDPEILDLLDAGASPCRLRRSSSPAASARGSPRRRGAPEADGRDRRAPDPLAHHEDLRGPRRRRVRDLLRLQGLRDQGLLRELLRCARPTSRSTSRRTRCELEAQGVEPWRVRWSTPATRR